MPVGKMLAGHTPVTAYLFDYLERARDGSARAIAHDAFNIGGRVQRENWGAVMDRTRRAFGNDTSFGGRPARTYLHYIISPDPRDAVDLDTLRTLVSMWYDSTFGAVPEPGAPLGPEVAGVYQAAVVYHDDNVNGIPHAHVVINNTDLVTGRRVQVSKRQLKLIDARLQQHACELGLRYFGDGGFVQTPQDVGEDGVLVEMEAEAIARLEVRVGERGRPEAQTVVERDMAADGRVSWKQRMRDLVDIAVSLSSTPEEFERKLAGFGVSVARTKGGADYLFAFAGETARKVSGRRLGADYTPGRIPARIAEANARWGGVSRPRQAYLANAERVVSDVMGAVEGARVVASGVPDDVSLHDVAVALKVNERFGITSAVCYDAALRKHSIAMNKARAKGDAVAERAHGKAVRDLSAAKRIADACDLFEGVGHGVLHADAPDGEGASGRARAHIARRGSGTSSTRERGPAPRDGITRTPPTTRSRNRIDEDGSSPTAPSQLGAGSGGRSRPGR